MRFRRLFRNIPILAALAVALAVALAGAPARAGDNDVVPYWASLRAKQVNMHVGPGEDYRTSFRYHREDLPMKVLRKMEGWRLVQDPDGSRGWMLARFLKPERGAIVVAAKGGSGAGGDGLAEMHQAPDAGSRLLWRLEPGVTGKLGDCAEGWCKFVVGGSAGYVREDALWGPGQP
ncbi:MAG TPA: SH3 domain-containing protein [Novosphingobium sp.]|jgi:SH3-like domain-containing protein|nr:SH3 domain-containing protein [Novosphingobium sp.]